MEPNSASPFLRKHQRLLYYRWMDHNWYNIAIFNTYVGLFVSFLMLPGDFLFLKEATPLSVVRLAGIVALSICLFLTKWGRPNESKDNLKIRFLWVKKASTLFAISLYQAQYFYFCFGIENEKFHVYFFGLLLGIFFGGFLIHKLWVETYVFHFGGIAGSLIATQFIDSSLMDYNSTIVIVHGVSLFVMWQLRREFFNSLATRYSAMCAVLPKQLATELAVSSSNFSLQNYFDVRSHFTVCLVSDWRGYQRIAETHSPDQVLQATEYYYNLVFSELEKIDPIGKYFINWTADELFVVFYDNEKDDEKDVIQRAFLFSKVLATNIFSNFNEKSTFKIRYDIGLAAGYGLLGLQGPSNLKKLTITGATPGLAKRLESEAKVRRSKLNSADLYPMIFVDSTIYDVLKKNDSFRKVVAKTKDIKGRDCYVYLPRATAAEDDVA